MLEAMCHARFSVWRIDRRHERAGLIITDVLREAEVWLVDEQLEASAPEGLSFAGRLCQPDDFARTGRRFIGPELQRVTQYAGGGWVVAP